MTLNTTCKKLGPGAAELTVWLLACGVTEQRWKGQASAATTPMDAQTLARLARETLRLRCGELRRLTLDNIDLERGLAIVQQELARRIAAIALLRDRTGDTVTYKGTWKLPGEGEGFRDGAGGPNFTALRLTVPFEIPFVEIAA